MKITRVRNGDWRLVQNADGTFPPEQVQIALLMDIRDELQKLNGLLGCHNVIAIPRILRRISANTAKPRKKKRAAPARTKPTRP